MPISQKGHIFPPGSSEGRIYYELIPGQYQGDCGIPRLCPGPNNPNALLTPKTAGPKGTGSEKPWQLVVSSRPGSQLGPPKPQTHHQSLTPPSSDTSSPYTPTATKTSPEPRPIQTEKRKKAQLFVFHFAKTLYVCLYNPD